MVDKKIKPVAVPLPEDSWQKMKEVANDPSLRDPKKIGHDFTKETKGKLRVGKEDFLLPEEDRMFHDMLERHGKAFAFLKCLPRGVLRLCLYGEFLHCIRVLFHFGDIVFVGLFNPFGGLFSYGLMCFPLRHLSF